MKKIILAMAFFSTIFTFSFPAKAVIVDIGGAPTWDDSGCRINRDCSLCSQGWMNESFCCVEKRVCDGPAKSVTKKETSSKKTSKKKVK